MNVLIIISCGYPNQSHEQKIANDRRANYRFVAIIDKSIMRNSSNGGIIKIRLHCRCMCINCICTLRPQWMCWCWCLPAQPEFHQHANVGISIGSPYFRRLNCRFWGTISRFISHMKSLNMLNPHKQGQLEHKLSSMCVPDSAHEFQCSVIWYRIDWATQVEVLRADYDLLPVQVVAEGSANVVLQIQNLQYFAPMYTYVTNNPVAR